MASSRDLYRGASAHRSPVGRRYRPAGRPRVRRRSRSADALPRSTRPPAARSSARPPPVRCGAALRDLRHAVVRRRLEAGPRGHRRRRQGGGLHDRTPAQGRVRRGVDGARPAHPAGRVPGARADSGARGGAGGHRGARFSPASAWTSTRRASASGPRPRTLTVVASAAETARRTPRARGGGSARTDPRRLQQSRARLRQRAVQRADPARVRGTRRGASRRTRASASRSSTRRRSTGSGWGCCSASRAGAPSRRGSSSCATIRPARRSRRSSASSARASRSTPAASRSSRPTAWSG